MMPEYVVIHTPAPFLTAQQPAQVGKRMKSGNGMITFYKPVLTGLLREVSEIVEKLNAAAVPTVPISELPE